MSPTQVQKPTGNKFVRDPRYGPPRAVSATLEYLYECGRQFLQTTAHEPSHALTSRVVFNNERTQLNAPTGQRHVFQKLLRDTYKFGTDIVPVDGLNFSTAICWPMANAV